LTINISLFIYFLPPLNYIQPTEGWRGGRITGRAMMMDDSVFSFSFARTVFDKNRAQQNRLARDLFWVNCVVGVTWLCFAYEFPNFITNRNKRKMKIKIK